MSLSSPFSSSQSSSEEAAPHLIKLSTSLHLFPPFACPFGPDPCAPTTGQRSRCNRHSQPTHQTSGETCRGWIATDRHTMTLHQPCLPELCPSFDFVSGFVHSLSCYSPGLDGRAVPSNKIIHHPYLFICNLFKQESEWSSAFRWSATPERCTRNLGKMLQDQQATCQPRVSP